MKLFLIKYESKDGYEDDIFLTVAESKEEIMNKWVKDILKEEEDTTEEEARERLEEDCLIDIEEQDEVIDGYKITLTKVG